MSFELFHFLRPWWLLALLPFLLLLVLAWKQSSNHSDWSRIVAPELLQHLLLEDTGKRVLWTMVAVGLAGLLSILALAGPTWERLPQPVYRSAAPLVLVLDLSRSMDAADVKPSRLIRARYKLADILKQRNEGQTALIVYAADAFAVTPLTDDTATIASQLPALTTALVPAQGSHAGRALELAIKLLQQTDQQQGDILLITDEVRQLPESLISDLPYRLSILGVGTREGAPIPVQGGMLKDASGNIVIPSLDENELRRVAAEGGGFYATLSLDDGDLAALKITTIDGQADAQLQNHDALTADQWREFGPWLLIVVLPLAALVFRRGILLSLVIVLPIPDPVEASMWQDLWYRADQQGEQLLQQDKPAEAAERFKDPAWQAAARYKAGEYEQAADVYSRLTSVEDRYNQGNALAKAGKLKEAVKVYEQGLKLDPQHADMQHNKQLVEKLLQEQEQQNQEQQNQEQQNQEQQNQEQQNQEQQNQEQQNQEQQNQEQQNQDQQNQEQQDQEQHEQQQEQQKAEEKQAAEQNKAERQENQENQPMDESQMAREQWLKRIPDDPAGLLKRKFQYQYSRRHRAPTEQQQW